MHWSLVPALLWLSISAAQSTSDVAPELLTLAKIKVRMQETLARQPNYTCTEQIERSRRRAPKGKYELLDMVRLEVALVDGKEMFAWPGSRKFEEQELSKLVPIGGAIGNGNFALFTRTVFLSRAPVFNYVGVVDLNGKPAIRYNYTVSEFISGFHLRVNNIDAIVGFSGSFWVNPNTLDLMRLDVVAEKIPEAMGLSKSITTMEYAPTRIGAADFLLPVGSELVMTHTNGDEDHNRMSFQACRQYTGDSVITFSESPVDTTAPSLAPAVNLNTRTPIDVPAGLLADVTLDAAIDGDHSMVGDLVKVTLRQPLKKGKEILFEKGATLTGRILKLERHRDHCVLNLQFFEIESDSKHADLTATVQEAFLLARSPGTTHLMPPPTVHPGDSDSLTIANARLHLARGLHLRLITR